ncbi:hypothetical protein [Streptomyces shenzhenensis]|uniref:hypothetical protein n=1 Tax=Streptomyces shenzhenensis TaxID=943815 RepID=UPI001F1F392C|nr:hypothetical protein [Streptomyces shenzhenensis]
MGALNATGTWSFADVAVGAFVAGGRQQWDRLLAAVGSLRAFGGDGARATADSHRRSRPSRSRTSAASTGGFGRRPAVEHVACAGGAAVLGAREITFVREAVHSSVADPFHEPGDPGRSGLAAGDVLQQGIAARR